MITPLIQPVSWRGRAVILLCENDGSTPHFHGIAISRKGIGVNVAFLTVNDALEYAKEKNPDEWNYDDVHKYLRDRGWEIINPSIWVEQ